ncbi:MAG TPA: PQQ-binding-like beta-propeller repeat protein [Candidatus Binataceae bacterium]|nr:PQQ-binding-like beta-propeller repeat protein [Candidatus Binataceae bacterium]
MKRAILLCSLAAVASLWQQSVAAAGSPYINNLSNTVGLHSGPIVINGSGFGEETAGQVTIEGIPAWTTHWNDSQIVAYVPESAAVGPNSVEVTHSGQKSNAASLLVEERPVASGSVAWRFEVLANYISHRADVGRDGTVYFNDSSGFLYALTPEGALKWAYDAHSVGSSGPTGVGRDGTIYFGVAAPTAALHAVNPDGTAKWIFQAPGSQGPIGGPNVGPDGNIYTVFDLGGSIGAVSHTPAGVVCWNNLGNLRVAELGQLGRELVFGGGKVYFTSTYYGDVYGFDLDDGTQTFYTNIGTADQAATARNGNLYVPTSLRLNAYSKNGMFRWSFFGDINPPTNDLTAPDVDRNGNIYINRNLSELYSLTPAPAVRWFVPSLVAGGPVPGPIVSPNNDLVLMGGQETFGQPGLIRGFATLDGALLFEINIPKEPDGTCAVPYARARFTRAGDRAYIPAAQLCEVPRQYHSWLYALDIDTAAGLR